MSGIFTVKIFPVQETIPALVETASSDNKTGVGIVDGVNLSVLKAKLDEIDFQAVAKRRKLYNRLYHEALAYDEPGKGMSFTNMLLLLAHHKLIDDDNALQ